MSKSTNPFYPKQLGIIHLLPIFILLVGLVAGIYLIQQNTNVFRPKGGGQTIVLAGLDGQELTKNAENIYTSSAFRLKVKLSSPFGLPVPSPTSTPSPTPKPATEVTIRAWGVPAKGNPVIALRDGDSILKTFEVKATSKKDANIFTYTFPNGKTFKNKPSIRFTNDFTIGKGKDYKDRNVYIDYISINGIKYESEDPKTYSTGTSTKDTKCNVGGFKKLEILHCAGFFRYDQYSPFSIQGGSPPNIYTAFYKIAESSLELETSEKITYNSDPQEIEFEFKEKTYGRKNIWVEFISSGGLTEKRNVEIEIQLPPTPTPFPTPVPTPGPNDTSYLMKVLVIKYFPVTPDGKIDISVTGDVGESYDFIRQRTIDVTNNLITSLERSSTYLGYKYGSNEPALRYQIIDTKEYQKAVPTKELNPFITRIPDYYAIMYQHKICDYVENLGVSEVWVWAYQGPKQSDGYPYLNIQESIMEGPHGGRTEYSKRWEIPLCKKTYRVYTFNFNSGTAEALESWGHQMQDELFNVDRILYNTFKGPQLDPKTFIETGIARCGDVHSPPNARSEYDRANPIPKKSDCLDWQPDGLGALSDISCQNWGCKENSTTDNSALNYMVWMWQNLPGRNNTKTYQGKQLRNWWDVHGDYDNVMSNSRRLTL